MEEKRKDSMAQFEGTKLLPMHQEMRTKFESIEYEIKLRFNLVDEKFVMIDHRFNLVDEKFAFRLSIFEINKKV